MCHRAIRIVELAIVFITLIFALPQTAGAILAEVSLTELVGMSDHVVRARVLSKSSAWNAEHTQILTTVLIRVDESMSGWLVDSTVATLIVPGGTVDNLTMEVEHAPVFAVDEDVILFLSDIDSQYVRVSGWEAGKFTLRDGRVAENGLAVTEFQKQLTQAIKSAGRR